MARAEQFIARRRVVGQWLDEELGHPQVQLLQPSRHGRHNGLYYGVLVDRPVELGEFLFRRGIDCETANT